MPSLSSFVRFLSKRKRLRRRVVVGTKRPAPLSITNNQKKAGKKARGGCKVVKVEPTEEVSVAIRSKDEQKRGIVSASAKAANYAREIAETQSDSTRSMDTADFKRKVLARHSVENPPVVSVSNRKSGSEPVNRATRGIDQDDDNSEAAVAHGSSRNITFADEGEPTLAVCPTTTTKKVNVSSLNRFFILLLCPKRRKFEFVHLAYSPHERTTIKDLIQQIPDYATDYSLGLRRWVALARPVDEGREMINLVSVQSYKLKRDELLLAIHEGTSPKRLLKIAAPFMASRRINSAIRNAKRSGGSIQKIKPSTEWKALRRSRAPPEVVIINPCTEIARQLDDSDSLDDNSESSREDLDDIPDMDWAAMETDKDYMEDCNNQNKVALTRVLTLGVVTTVAMTLHKQVAFKIWAAKKKLEQSRSAPSAEKCSSDSSTQNNPNLPCVQLHGS